VGQSLTPYGGFLLSKQQAGDRISSTLSQQREDFSKIVEIYVNIVLRVAS
jgi:hypothetical protein